MTLQDYFQSYEGYFWEWEKTVLETDSVFETVSIPDGAVIAYERYVFETLRYLSEESFPPFGALLLVIAATNPEAARSIEKIFETVEKNAIEDDNYDPEVAAEAKQFLIILSKLPTEFRIGNKRKQLFRLLFENVHNRLSSEKAKKILEEYKTNKHLLLHCAQKLPFSFANYMKDFRTIAKIGASFSSKDIILQGLKDIPEIVEISEEILVQEATEKPKDFVRELIETPKTFYVGSLIRRIWSGLNIPLHHSAPSHQPLGGISDLTNKGDFDKLLISEFANDDDVFMSRVANHEALYIQREVPPESDDFFRTILIDASLKNWGTPKILAFASAIGIATHPKTDIPCKIFVVDDHFKEVLFSEVSEVIDGLSILGKKLDSAQGIAAFFSENEEAKNGEIFLVTSESTLALPMMQTVLSDHSQWLNYMIVTDANGMIDFFRVRNKGRKHIQKIVLPLEDLWKNPTVEKRPERSKFPTEINEKAQYPIYFPPAIKNENTFFYKNNMYILAANKSLHRRSQQLEAKQTNYATAAQPQYKGSDIIFENVSIKNGGLMALGEDEDGYVLCAYYAKLRLVTYLNIKTKFFRKETVELVAAPEDYVITCFEGKFFLYNDHTAEVYDINCHNKQLVSETDELFSATSLKQADKVTEQRKRNFYNYGSAMISNYAPVFIDTENKLHLNRQELTVASNTTYEYFILARSRQMEQKFKATFVDDGYTFSDGSKIIKDKRGILTLRSSNPEIPSVYMPTSVNFQLGLATDDEFTGNVFFYKDADLNPLKKIPVAEFEQKYIAPFINTIVTHGT